MTPKALLIRFVTDQWRIGDFERWIPFSQVSGYVPSKNIIEALWDNGNPRGPVLVRLLLQGWLYRTIAAQATEARLLQMARDRMTPEQRQRKEEDDKDLREEEFEIQRVKLRNAVKDTMQAKDTPKTPVPRAGKRKFYLDEETNDQG